MWRALLLLCGLWTLPASAQPADCDAQPNGPPLPLQAEINIGKRPGVPGTKSNVYIDLGSVPANGTTCDPDFELPDDVLHGTPAPHGLLQGNGPKDVLHNRPEGTVTVRPMPDARRPLRLHGDD